MHHIAVALNGCICRIYDVVNIDCIIIGDQQDKTVTCEKRLLQERFPIRRVFEGLLSPEEIKVFKLNLRAQSINQSHCLVTEHT